MKALLCLLGRHAWGLMRAYRLRPSIVYVACCRRCGKRWDS